MLGMTFLLICEICLICNICDLMLWIKLYET